LREDFAAGTAFTSPRLRGEVDRAKRGRVRGSLHESELGEARTVHLIDANPSRGRPPCDVRRVVARYSVQSESALRISAISTVSGATYCESSICDAEQVVAFGNGSFFTFASQKRSRDRKPALVNDLAPSTRTERPPAFRHMTSALLIGDSNVIFLCGLVADRPIGTCRAECEVHDEKAGYYRNKATRKHTNSPTFEEFIHGRN
jgi:hypothetical protein